MADGLIFGPAPWQILMVGAKHSGKSQCIKYVCRAYASQFACIVVFCPTALNGFYSFIPKRYVHDDYDPEVMREILTKQEDYKRAGKSVHVLCVFDDIIGSETINFEKRQQNELNRVFCANRHYNLSVIVVTQSLKRVPRILRDNVDGACIFRCMRQAYEGLYETFGHMDKKDFYKFLDEGTRDYQVILYKANVSNPKDHFACFKIPQFEIARKFALLY